MLILARRINESIMIGDQIEVAVVDIKGDQVKIGIAAPRHVKVYRQEVYQAIQQENLQAAKAAPESLPKIEGLLGPSAGGPQLARPSEGGPQLARPSEGGPQSEKPQSDQPSRGGPKENPPAR